MGIMKNGDKSISDVLMHAGRKSVPNEVYKNDSFQIYTERAEQVEREKMVAAMLYS